MRFAAVIPNLNQSHFLPDALESFRHQSVPFELAVMDGGSSDHFNEVIDKYADIVTYMRSAPDNGQAEAIRNGKKSVNGDIVCWLNADDYYFPGALQKVSAFFSEHPDVDVVYGDAIHVKPDGAFLSYFPTIQEFDAAVLPFSCFICQPACFVRLSAYEAVGGIDPALKYTMDWDLWCRLAANGARFFYISEVLAAVRYYPGTKTLSGSRQRYFEIWRIGWKYGKRLIPLSWLGFYHCDLSFKKKKTVIDSICLNVLDSLRQLRKKIAPRPRELLYGFYRWESIVDGQCLIQLPLYNGRQSNRINLRVSPAQANYRVIINSVHYRDIKAVNGIFNIELPDNAEPFCKIHIECQDQQIWHLTDFHLIL